MSGSATTALTAALLCASCAAAAGPARRVHLVETRLPDVPGRVLEATLAVPEDPGRPGGRELQLFALILAADGPDRRADPLLVLQGGPGQSASELAPYYARFLAAVRAHRDIILLDQRGTGRSGALRASVPPGRLLDDLGAIAPASWIAPTLAALRDVADLTQYTTARIVDDADRLLAALGHRRVNLYGTSYGARCALAFVARHPGRVRSVVLKNVLPMRAIIPLTYAANAQRALELLLADVDADPAARAAYPGLGAALDGLLDRLERAPARVRVRNPTTDRDEEVELGRAGVAMTVRMLLMAPQSRAALPYLVTRAAAGDYLELAQQMVQLRAAYARTLALGMSMSVIAAEDCPRLSPELVARDARGSFLQGGAMDSFRAACAVWPRGRVPPGFFEPVRSTVPALLVSGRLDPATPPAYADEVARDLPNAARVVFRHAAHPGAGFDRLDELVAAFVEAGSAKGLDLSIGGQGAPVPFKLPGP